jgi:hypothetical protein
MPEVPRLVKRERSSAPIRSDNAAVRHDPSLTPSLAHMMGIALSGPRSLRAVGALKRPASGYVFATAIKDRVSHQSIPS